MRSLGEVLKMATQFLSEKRVEAPRFSAERLLAHALGIQRVDLYLKFDSPLVEKELASFRELIRRRATGEPVDYILGSSDFLGCRLRLTPEVLIPRPETEVWLEEAIRSIPHEAEAPIAAPIAAWDLATGAGAIAIALKRYRPHLAVTASDISSAALALARENAASAGVEIELLEGDLLAPFAGRKAHLFFCNPPYIAERDQSSLSKEVSCFEPARALFGGEDGLFFYRRLAEELPPCLYDKAKIFLEIGSGQGGDVKKIFSSSCWSCHRVDLDWAGHERLLFLEFSSAAR